MLATRSETATASLTTAVAKTLMALDLSINVLASMYLEMDFSIPASPLITLVIPAIGPSRILRDFPMSITDLTIKAAIP